MNLSAPCALYREIKSLPAKGFWRDYLKTEKQMVEWKRCPICRDKFVYVGLSSTTVHKAYGVCDRCEYARLFHSETVAAVKAAAVTAEALCKAISEN